jgi:hypothetical protein
MHRQLFSHVAFAVPAKSAVAFSSKRKFSPDEDERLTQIVQQCGASNWKQIASKLGSRNFRQCRERWKNYLSPTICKDPWTPDEDLLLQEKYDELGSQWCVIAKFFPSRTDVSLKNRWVVLTSHSQPEPRIRRKSRKAPPDDAKPKPKKDNESEGDDSIARFCDQASLFEFGFSAAFGF